MITVAKLSLMDGRMDRHLVEGGCPTPTH